MYKVERFLIDQAGNAISGATVTVRIANATPHSGATATIYSDDGSTPTANPFTTASDGKWSFYAADNKYDIQFSYSGATAELVDFRIADAHSQTSTDVTWQVYDLNVANAATAASLTVTNDFVAGTINNVRYANAFAGATADIKIQAAHDDLPAAGGVIDARGLEGAQTLATVVTLSTPCKLLLGNATYTMSGGATECIRISSSGVHIIGSGIDKTILNIGSAVGATVDAIRIAGASADVIDSSVENLTIGVQSGTPGQYGLHIDTTSFAIYYLMVNKVKFNPMRLQAIWSTNPALTDGFFQSTIQQCEIDGGMKFNRCGDTIRILNNRFEGANTAIEADFVGGAAGMIIEGNNGWLSGGFIKLNAYANSTRIINNEFETKNPYTGVDGAMISIEGSAVAGEFARHILFRGNTFINIPAYSTAYTIRLNYANDTQIDGNYMTAGTGVQYVQVLANALYTRIGDNRWETQTIADVASDAGTLTTQNYHIAGLEYHAQPITVKNNVPLQWYDDGGALRNVVLTGATGLVGYQGFHARDCVQSADGVTYIYDSGNPSNKAATLYLQRIGVGATGGGGLPDSTVTLPQTGIIGWTDGAGTTDTGITRVAANRVGPVSTSAWDVRAGDMVVGSTGGVLAIAKVLTSTVDGRWIASATEVQTGTWTNHPYIFLTNSAEAGRITTGKDFLLKANVALGALAAASEQLSLTSTGKIGWDNGAAAIDTTLERSAANTLSLGANDNLKVPGGQVDSGSAAASAAQFIATANTVVGKMVADNAGSNVYIGTTSAHRTDFIANTTTGISIGTTGNVSIGGLTGGGEKLSLLSTAKIGWDDGAAAIDTNLYRSAANTLKTDDSLHVATDLKAQMGTSTTFSPAITTANVDVTAVGNVGVGEDNLISYALPANALNANGKAVEIHAWGSTANNANAKTLKVYFGSQLVLTNALTAGSANRWSVRATVVRTGASAEDWVAELVETGTGNSDIEVGTAAESTAGGITIKCTGEATADNDIVNEGLIVKFLN